MSDLNLNKIDSKFFNKIIKIISGITLYIAYCRLHILNNFYIYYILYIIILLLLLAENLFQQSILEENSFHCFMNQARLSLVIGYIYLVRCLSVYQSRR